MAKVVTCPSCQAKGSVPDDAKAARIRCPKCGQMFDVKGASGGASLGVDEETGCRGGPASRPRSLAPPLMTISKAPSLCPRSRTRGSRRSMPAAPGRGQAHKPRARGSRRCSMWYSVSAALPCFWSSAS